MLIAVRHGSTQHNATTPGAEKTRGHLPIPLALKGMKESREVAELLERIEDIHALYTSDLVRAVQTAEDIAQTLSMEIEPKEELRDWDIGEFAGLDVSKTLKDLHGFIDNPRKKVPGGESFQDFLDRTIPFLHEIVENDDICIAVTHNRVTTLIAALAKNKGDYPSTATLKSKGPIEPGKLMFISKDWEIAFKS